MRRPLWLLLVSLCACPPEPPHDCVRTLVDTSGSPNGGFGGGLGADGGDQDGPLGFVDAPFTLTVFAPLSACEPDVLRADATLFDPDNAPLQFSVERPVARVGAPLAVSASYTFTPRKAGVHTLKVAFEPSLGVRSVVVWVAADGPRGLTTHVPIVGSARCTYWPLSDDTVACADERSHLVTVSSADGGLTQFPGEELVVADTVLWSIDGTSNTLERRVFEDGGVRVTHRFADFPVLATPGLHDVDVALRSRASGTLTRVRITPTGESLSDFIVEPGSFSPLAYFVEPDDKLYRWSRNQCFSTPCTNFDDLVGLEPGFVWRAQSDFTVRGQVNAFERPLERTASARFAMRRQTMPNSSPIHPFERIPVWLDPVAGERRVLVSIEGGGLRFSAWPWLEVLNVGRHHVVLTDSGAFVRVVRR